MMTEERNYLPDPLGCCPVCHESWDAGGGKSKILTSNEIITRYSEGYLTRFDTLGEPIGYQCPFCKTEWEV